MGQQCCTYKNKLSMSLNQWINMSLLLYSTQRHPWEGCILNNTFSVLLFVLHSPWRCRSALLWDHDVCAAGVLDLLAAGRDDLLLQEDLQVWWAGTGHSVSLTQTQIMDENTAAFSFLWLTTHQGREFMSHQDSVWQISVTCVRLGVWLLHNNNNLETYWKNKFRRQSGGRECRTERKGKSQTDKQTDRQRINWVYTTSICSNPVATVICLFA